MTDTSRAARFVVVAGATVLLLAACDGDEGELSGSPTSPAPVTSSAPPSTSETAATSETPTLSPAQQDRSDVEATVLAYAEALSQAYAGGDIEGIYPWSRDVARDQWTTQIMAEREQGLTISGLTDVEVREVAVDGDQADVLACVDYSEITVSDAEGQDITPDRETGDLILNDYVLERYDDGEHGWIVVDDTSRSEPCDG
ncbi:hypothetical protein BJF86_13390 [Serinicoccus sp. CNJ-927]|uniref:hypothetical protein n=1 Tax=Serinicoccus sp. CNJ-927 TaxID=1904970 RepID=UPI00095B1C6B|nr:hypothetical protein [Serinicoccus sp. CNJ-927]OLT43947.1 hypothetical protein BJF86_13390 [Serinicoccus sp. CNJ-927]